MPTLIDFSKRGEKTISVNETPPTGILVYTLNNSSPISFIESFDKIISTTEKRLNESFEKIKFFPEFSLMEEKDGWSIRAERGAERAEVH